MKCFNHEDREAAATCQRCGKGLCRACASKYTPCLCDECFEAIQNEHRAQQAAAVERRRQSRLDKLTFSRNDLILNCLLGAPFAIYTIYTLIAESYGFSLENILVIPWMFCLPAGWRTMSKWIRLREAGSKIIFIDTHSVIYMIIAHLLLRSAGALFLGIPAFLFQIYKVSRAKKAVDMADREALNAGNQ